MPDTAAAEPQQIGPYRIEHELGRGAFGVVYRASRSDQPNESVALKVVHSQGTIDRLLVEPQILSQLQHPHIVGLRDYFLENTSIVMALEFIQGHDLKDALARRGRFSASDVRLMLRQMASALAVAHAAGICHRDIKLPNIMIEEQARSLRFVLTDFGISRLAQGIQLSKRTGGTYQFMAPEQLRGRPGPQSDLWALGVTAYAMLTGRLPFPGTTYEELSREILYSSPKPITHWLPDFADDDLERIIFDLLEKPLHDRMPSANELVKRLGGENAPSSETVVATTKQETSTYETRLKARVRRSWRYALGSFLLLSGPYGFVTQIFSLAGVYLFFRSQRASRWFAEWGWTLLAWCAMGMAWAALTFTPAAFTLLGVPSDAMFVMALMAIVFNIVFGFAGIFYFMRARQLERELALREVVMQNATNPEDRAKLFESFLVLRSDDVALHQKYVELLLANGQPEAAAVEATLLLANDGYNVGGNLLLAQSYFDLGLYPQCVEMCEKYLQITGYCFEFSDLKAECDNRMGAAACIST